MRVTFLWLQRPSRFSGILYVLYDYLIIPVVHTLHHASKVVARLFHAFITVQYDEKII